MAKKEEKKKEVDLVEESEIVETLPVENETPAEPKTIVKLIFKGSEMKLPVALAIEMLKQRPEEYSLAEGETVPEVIENTEPKFYTKKYLQEQNEVKLREVYLKLANKGASSGWQKGKLIEQILLEQEDNIRKR